MATDFRFNGQQSYSPLLAALANAPVQKAQLAIQQEQNQRQRLSDLLTNISSAAATARQVQLIHQQNVEQGARESTANSMTPQNGSLYLGNPSFQQSFGGMAGTGAGIDTMFGNPQPQVPLAGEGVTANNGNLMGVDTQSLIQKMKLKAAGATPQVITDPNTGLNQEIYPGTGIKPKPIDTPPEKGFNPIQNKAIDETRKEFQDNDTVKKSSGLLDLLDELETGVKSGNPAYIQNIKFERAQAGGIPGGRITTGEQAGEFGSAAFDKKLGRRWQQFYDGTLTGPDKADFIDQIQLQKNVLSKQLIDARDSFAEGLTTQHPDINKNRARLLISRGFEEKIGRYNPNYSSIYKQKSPKNIANQSQYDSLKTGDQYLFKGKLHVKK